LKKLKIKKMKNTKMFRPNDEGECEVLNPGGADPPAGTDPHVLRLRHEVLVRQARGLLDRQKGQRTKRPSSADGFSHSDFISKADAWLARERDKNREGAERRGHTGLTPRNSPGGKASKRRRRARRSKSQLTAPGTHPSKSTKKRHRPHSYSYGEVDENMPSTEVMRGLLRQQRQARAVQPVPQAVPHPAQQWARQQQAQVGGGGPGHRRGSSIPGVNHPIPLGTAEEERLVKGEGGLDYVERGLGAQVNKLEEKGAAESIGWQTLLYLWFLVSAGVMIIVRHHLSTSCGNLRRFCLIFLFSALLSLFINAWVVLLRVHVPAMKKLSCFPLLVANLLALAIIISLSAGELFDPTCGDAWARYYMTACWALFVFVMPIVPLAMKLIGRRYLFWYDVFMLQVIYATHAIDVLVRSNDGGDTSDLTPFLVGSTVLAVVVMLATVHMAFAVVLAVIGIALSVYSIDAAFAMTGSYGIEAQILLVACLVTSAFVLGHTVWGTIRNRGKTPPVPPPMALDPEKPEITTARSEASHFSDMWFSKTPLAGTGQLLVPGANGKQRRRRRGKSRRDRTSGADWSAIGQEGSSSSSSEVVRGDPRPVPSAAAAGRIEGGEKPIPGDVEMVVKQKPGRKRAASLGYRSLDGSDAPFTTPATSVLPASADHDQIRPEPRSYVHLLDEAEGSSGERSQEDRVAIQILPSDPDGPTDLEHGASDVDEEEKAQEAPLLVESNTPGDDSDRDNSPSPPPDSNLAPPPADPPAFDPESAPPVGGSHPSPQSAPPAYQELPPDEEEAQEELEARLPVRRVEPGPNGGLVVTGPPPPVARDGAENDDQRSAFAMRFGAQSRCSQSHHSGLSGPSSEATPDPAATQAAHQQRQRPAADSGSADSTSGTTATTSSSGTSGTTSSSSTSVSEPLPPPPQASQTSAQQQAGARLSPDLTTKPDFKPQGGKDVKDESAHASPEPPATSKASEPVDKGDAGKKAKTTDEEQPKREIQQRQEDDR